ncbi:hypothetical protein MKX08_007088 [Trichoderma sp. CBMAI-0020]|nr:hypothetical protein MKX08_007088 [Trichoderma sp. CBMAI-0020]WOD46577.1 hypothetical protein [Trichoderma atroviride]
MPPKRIYGEKGRRAPKGFVSSTYDALTSAENAAFVRSIAIFGAAVTFLSSSWGEILLPPYDSPMRLILEKRLLTAEAI